MTTTMPSLKNRSARPRYLAYRNGIFGPRYWNGVDWTAERKHALPVTHSEWEGLIQGIPKAERMYYGYLPI